MFLRRLTSQLTNKFSLLKTAKNATIERTLVTGCNNKPNVNVATACSRTCSTKIQVQPLISTEEDWDYEDYGPYYWPFAFPDGRGLHQSPINIDTTSQNCRYDVTLGPVNSDYEFSKASSIVNNGNSFRVIFDSDSPATISGGPLEDVFQLSYFQGHWGPRSDLRGSEHTINNRSFPAELHFVHFNKTKYSTIEEAVRHKDGLVGLAVFLKVDPTNIPHPWLETLLEEIKGIDYNDSPVPLISTLQPRCLMPESLIHYFTYSGSLTTPPLSQCITWIVFADPVLVSSNQLSHFHHLHRPRTQRIIDRNYRPVMPVNGRIIRASFLNYSNHTFDGPIAG